MTSTTDNRRRERAGMSEREVVARIIDPAGWTNHDRMLQRAQERDRQGGAYAEYWGVEAMRETIEREVRQSLAKADAVLAALADRGKL